MKGSIARAIDSAVDEHVLRGSIFDIWKNFEMVGHSRSIFIGVLNEMMKKYPYLMHALPHGPRFF